MKKRTVLGIFAILLLVGILFLIRVNIIGAEVLANPGETLLVFYNVQFDMPATEIIGEGGINLGSLNEVSSSDGMTITGTNFYRGGKNEFLIEIWYINENTSSSPAAPQLAYVFRDQSGIPWLTGQIPITEQTNEERVVSIQIQFDDNLFPKYPERAVSSVEVGISGKEFAVAGPGHLSLEEKASLTPLVKIGEFRLSD